MRLANIGGSLVELFFNKGIGNYKDIILSGHPHVHALVANGLFTESGYFYVMQKVAIRLLAALDKRETWIQSEK